jgi:hypothetical protein
MLAIMAAGWLQAGLQCGISSLWQLAARENNLVALKATVSAVAACWRAARHRNAKRAAAAKMAQSVNRRRVQWRRLTT